MKVLSLIALLPLAFALTERQAAGTPPTCAVGCLAEVSLNPAPCSGTDFVCLCTNTELQTKITTCLTAACSSTAQLSEATLFLQNTCREAGAPVPSVSGLPNPIASVSSAVASGASSIQSGASAVASSASSAAGAAASSASAAISSASGAIASATSSAASAASSVAVAVTSSRSGAEPTGIAKAFVAAGLGAAGALLL